MTGMRCMIMRGGSSKGAYFLRDELPASPRERDDVLLRVMGSPDERQIDGMGGATAAIEKGHFQRAIAKSAYRQQQEIEQGERLVVGVNSYEVDEPEKMDVLKVDPSIREAKLAALAKLRAERDGAAVSEALKRLEADAAAGTPTMAAALECARARATLGEMSKALERVFGRYRPSETAW